MKIPTFEEDLDAVMRLGYGRRLLRRMIQAAKEPQFSSDPLAMAYSLGLSQSARDLERQMRDVNPEAWIIMQREMLDEEEAVAKEPARDE